MAYIYDLRTNLESQLHFVFPGDVSVELVNLEEKWVQAQIVCGSASAVNASSKMLASWGSTDIQISGTTITTTLPLNFILSNNDPQPNPVPIVDESIEQPIVQQLQPTAPLPNTIRHKRKGR